MVLIQGSSLQYNETQLAEIQSQGSLSGYVTFKAETPRGPLLHYGSSLVNSPKIRTTAKQYVWIEGLRMTQTARGTGAGDRLVSFWWDGSFNGSHYCVLKNCEIYEAIQPVKSQAGQYVTYDGCTFHDIGWGASFFACNNCQMINCEIYDFDADGVQDKGGCKNIRIGRCLFRITHNVTSGTWTKDGAVYIGGSSTGATTGTTLDPSNTGVLDNTGWDGERNVIYSSIIFQEGSGQSPFGIIFMSAKDCAAINCTINANTSGGISTVFGFRTSSNTGWANVESGGMPRTKNPTVANCIVYAPGAVGFEQATGAKYDGTLTDRNNTIYNVSSGSAPASGSSPTTGTASTTNKLTSDPLFKTRASTFAASNLRLQDASPSKATGSTETFLDTNGLLIGSTGNPYPGNLPGVGIDFTGVVRSGTWDRGAYQDTVALPPTGWSPYAERVNLDAWFGTGTAIYLALHSAAPGSTGANELSGNGYARTFLSNSAAMFPAATSETTKSLKNNATAITVSGFTGSLGPATYISFWTAASGGNMIMSGELASPISIVNGTSITFAAGSIVIGEE